MTLDACDPIWDLRHRALHQALANRLYHQRCAAIFEARDRVTKLISLVGASAVFMTLSNKETAMFWALFAFVGSAASLVFRWSEKSRAAGEKMLQYAAIHADIVKVGQWDYDQKHVNGWHSQLNSISEPAPCEALWEKARYDADMALGSENIKPLTLNGMRPWLPAWARMIP